MKTVFLILTLMMALEGNEKIEVLDLDVIPYEDFVQEDPQAMSVLRSALYEKGIVGIRGIPGYKEKALKFIESAREFSALPEAVKELYAPNKALDGTFLGYESGKERFKRPDGSWVADDLKFTYYGYIPDCLINRWPLEVDIRKPFQELGALMSEMGESIMTKLGLLGSKTTALLGGGPRLGRMLYYGVCAENTIENPLWCGSHLDHGLFTALLPAFYFLDGNEVVEPIEAGLFIKTPIDGVFKKVIANDHDVLLFQVGEFGQLVTNDEIRATEHCVHKASGQIERYTMALFFEPLYETIIYSSSELTKDARYGGVAGEPCSYLRWNEESNKRYIIIDSIEDPYEAKK